MKFTTVTAGLLTFSTLGQAAINLTWTPDEVGRIRIGDEIRVSWETDRTYVRPNTSHHSPDIKQDTDYSILRILNSNS